MPSAISADLVTVFLTARVVGTLRRTERAQRWFTWVGGTVLAGLGVRLALDRS
jgi:threonine/homoserine/homoserine lactone efflux protein